MKELLAEEGYRVQTACDGREALERLQEVRPCLVILDLLMPVNGFEFLAVAKAEPRLAQIPVIVVSAGGARRGGPSRWPRERRPSSRSIPIEGLLGLVAQYCR